eukprot:RCo053637
MDKSTGPPSVDPEVEYDMIIVGAGPIGATLAATLGGAVGGRRVLLLERDLQEPHRIVGEYMQPEGIEMLRKLGLGHCIDRVPGRVMSKGYQIVFEGKFAELVYPTRDGSTERYQGCSFHHGRLVQSLRQAAREAPGVVLKQATVVALVHGSDGGVRGVVYRETKATVKPAAAEGEVGGAAA